MPSPLPSRAVAARGRLLVLAVPEQQHVVVLVAGEVDRASAQLLHDKLVDSLFYRPRSLVVDATDLTSCDAHGLDALFDFVAIAERCGTRVTLQRPRHPAWREADVRPAPRSSRGQAALDPAGCPLPRPSRQSA